MHFNELFLYFIDPIVLLVPWANKDTYGEGVEEDAEEEEDEEEDDEEEDEPLEPRP